MLLKRRIENRRRMVTLSHLVLNIGKTIGQKEETTKKG
jgi:hypothetical protein